MNMDINTFLIQILSHIISFSSVHRKTENV